MARAHGSKKKKTVSGLKPSYARGKPASGKSGNARSKKPARKSAQAVRDNEKNRLKDKDEMFGKDSKRVQPGFNLIRSGTLEMKVFQAMLVLVIVSILLQYPLWMDVVGEQYKESSREYRVELKKWEKEHKAIKGEKKIAEHEKKKPVKPVKPTFGVFIFYYMFMALIQGALFLFIGLNIVRRTDLETPLLNSLFSGQSNSVFNIRWFLRALIWSVAVFAPLAAAALIVKFAGTGTSDEMKYAVWKYSLHYAGFATQNQFLFLVMIFSGFVWIFSRYREKLKIEPHISGIVLTAAIAFLYFFQISRGGAEKVTTAALVSFFFVTSLVVIAGLLYWKKGLELSLISSFMGFALYPFFFGFLK